MSKSQRSKPITEKIIKNRKRHINFKLHNSVWRLLEKSDKAFLVAGFLKHLDLQNTMIYEIPDDLLVLIIMYFSEFINLDGNRVKLKVEEKILINTWFIKIYDNDTNKIFKSKLLYDYDIDGKTPNSYHKACDGHKNLFTIVETNYNGHIFGCFVGKDDKTFLCVIRS